MINKNLQRGKNNNSQVGNKNKCQLTYNYIKTGNCNKSNVTINTTNRESEKEIRFLRKQIIELEKIIKIQAKALNINKAK